MARLSVPTKARLPSSLRVEASDSAVSKSLGRLSRASLISLALNWLDDGSLVNTMPYLRLERKSGTNLARGGENSEEEGVEEEEQEDVDADDLYPPCRSVGELRDLYMDIRAQKGAKRDIVSRILEGDWRHGLTLYQLAMADCSYFDEHPTSQKWTAYAILPLKHPSTDADEEMLKVDKRSLTIPRFHPSTFLQTLQEQVLPDVKAHYHFYNPMDFPVLLLRIFIIESPYNTNQALSGRDSAGAATKLSSSRTIYLAFPNGSPSLYIAKSHVSGPLSIVESRSLQSLIVNGVPKALSRHQLRFTLKTTNLTSRNLGALLSRAGPGRENGAGGGWSIYADELTRKSPLDVVLPASPFYTAPSHIGACHKRQRSLTALERHVKRAKLVARARFGNSGIVTDGKGVEKVEILIQDPFPVSSPNWNWDPDGDKNVQQGNGNLSLDRRRSKLDALLQQVRADVEDTADEPDPSEWTPTVRLSFQGLHVFAGIRQIVEAGIVDGERMPGWMTGEEGVTAGVVRHGRVRGHKGSGL